MEISSIKNNIIYTDNRSIFQGNINEGSWPLLVEAAGVKGSDPFAQTEGVGAMLEVVGSESGMGGYEGAAVLTSTLMQLLKPLRRFQIPGQKMQGLVLEVWELYGGRMLAARFGCAEPPPLSAIPVFIQQKAEALRANVMALNEGSILDLIEQRIAAGIAGGRGSGIKREGEPAAGDSKRSHGEAVGGGARAKCFPALVGEECKKPGCTMDHVRGVPGVDTCPWRENCRRGSQCILAQSHLTAATLGTAAATPAPAATP
jgi:hypothetical protein